MAAPHSYLEVDKTPDHVPAVVFTLRDTTANCPQNTSAILSTACPVIFLLHGTPEPCSPGLRNRTIGPGNLRMVALLRLYEFLFCDLFSLLIQQISLRVHTQEAYLLRQDFEVDCCLISVTCNKRTSTMASEIPSTSREHNMAGLKMWPSELIDTFQELSRKTGTELLTTDKLFTHIKSTR